MFRIPLLHNGMNPVGLVHFPGNPCVVRYLCAARHPSFM
jgi:hypothetical protein